MPTGMMPGEGGDRRVVDIVSKVIVNHNYQHPEPVHSFVSSFFGWNTRSRTFNAGESQIDVR